VTCLVDGGMALGWPRLSADTGCANRLGCAPPVRAEAPQAILMFAGSPSSDRTPGGWVGRAGRAGGSLLYVRAGAFAASAQARSGVARPCTSSCIRQEKRPHTENPFRKMALLPPKRPMIFAHSEATQLQGGVIADCEAKPMSPKHRKRVALYLRVSTDGQTWRTSASNSKSSPSYANGKSLRPMRTTASPAAKGATRGLSH
jgi:hypothetical protein